VRVCNDVYQRTYGSEDASATAHDSLSPFVARLCGQGQVILCRAPADARIRRGRDADPAAVRNPPRSRAIASISVVVTAGGAVSPNTPIGRLSDVEMGWLVAAILFGWISTRAEQATDSVRGTHLQNRNAA